MVGHAGVGRDRFREDRLGLIGARRRKRDEENRGDFGRTLLDAATVEMEIVPAIAHLKRL